MYADNMQQIFAKALNVPAVSTSNRELLAAYHARGKGKVKGVQTSQSRPPRSPPTMPCPPNGRGEVESSTSPLVAGSRGGWRREEEGGRGG